jgi:hypothetical protein
LLVRKVCVKPFRINRLDFVLDGFLPILDGLKPSRNLEFFVVTIILVLSYYSLCPRKYEPLVPTKSLKINNMYIK